MSIKLQFELLKSLIETRHDDRYILNMALSNIRKNLNKEDLKDAIEEAVAFSEYNKSKYIDTVNIKDTEKHLLLKYILFAHALYDKKSPFLFKLVSAALNTGLISAYIKNTEKKQNNKADSIVGILLKKKIYTYTYCYISIMLSLILLILFTHLSIIQYNKISFAVIIISFMTLFANQQILKYRIKKGYYGNTRHEIIEILEFIQKHTEKNDFIDKNGSKKIFPAQEVDEVKCEDSVLVEA